MKYEGYMASRIGQYFFSLRVFSEPNFVLDMSPEDLPQVWVAKRVSETLQVLQLFEQQMWCEYFVVIIQ